MTAEVPPSSGATAAATREQAVPALGEAAGSPTPRGPGPEGPLRIAAVGDLHAHKAGRGQHRAMLAEVAQTADVLVLCGDLTNHGTPDEADVLAGELASLAIPVLAVPGNHDCQSGKLEVVKHVLQQAGVVFLSDETVTVRGVGFAGAKGFGGGFGGHMLSAFGEDVIKAFVAETINETLALENALKTLQTRQRVVALHYAPIAETCAGEPLEIWPFLGCSRLAETIDRFDVAAVFHGHAHRGRTQGRTLKGTPVHNVSMQARTAAGERPFLVVEV